ncbi:MAG: OmpA family protein [Salinivirgaceae bacterium]
MKKAVNYLSISTVLVGLLLTSCVSTKKFAASEASADKFQKESAATHIQLNDCNLQVDALNKEKTSLQEDKTSLQYKLALLQGYNKADSTESSNTIAQQAKQLNDFQYKIESQKKILHNLKNSIAEALINYKNDELYITVKNGKVYVSLEEKMLFKSGSDVVDQKGQDALKSLAKILNSTKEITVMIEGHTDSLPIKTEMFEDNWDLSTARATSILRVLTVDNGFDATRISASGMGQYHPIKSNETEEGRAANRRTEVILSPNLNELFNVLFN